LWGSHASLLFAALAAVTGPVGTVIAIPFFTWSVATTVAIALECIVDNSTNITYKETKNDSSLSWKFIKNVEALKAPFTFFMDLRRDLSNYWSFTDLPDKEKKTEKFNVLPDLKCNKTDQPKSYKKNFDIPEKKIKVIKIIENQNEKSK
jgi:hypothetical protein